MHTYIHTYIHTCLLLLISMLWHRQAIFKSKGDKLCSSAESRIWTWDPRHLFASRLNARWQTDWAIEDQAKNLNSTARPYDQRAFSPLGPTVSWLLHLALAIYMFVVVNFDALAQARYIHRSLSYNDSVSSITFYATWVTTVYLAFVTSIVNVYSEFPDQRQIIPLLWSSVTISY